VADDSVLAVCNVWTPKEGYCQWDAKGPLRRVEREFDEHLVERHARPPAHGPWSGLAVFSPDSAYRYALRRPLVEEHDQLSLRPGGKGRLLVVCLNPSTADEHRDDPTVARLTRWARDRDFRELVVANIFALRATDPREMRAHPEPVGELNDRWLRKLAEDADVIVAAWGSHGEHLERGRRVFRMLGGPNFAPAKDLRPVFCFELTKGGHPRHPLYLRRDVELRLLERVP
jgi:hypothetical protein